MTPIQVFNSKSFPAYFSYLFNELMRGFCISSSLQFYPSDISSPSLILSYSLEDNMNNGMFASAQPDATVRSIFWQAIASGATLFDFSE